MNCMNRAENQSVREWAPLKFVEAQVDFSEGF